MSTKNTILLKGDARQDELRAAGSITPGHLMQRGSANTLVVHATEGGYAERMFAIEDSMQGKTIADVYTTGLVVTFVQAQKGNLIHAWLKAGENVAIGDRLISEGDGTLSKESNVSSGTTVKDIIGVAEEAVDLSASTAVNTRIEINVT